MWEEKEPCWTPRKKAFLTLICKYLSHLHSFTIPKGNMRTMTCQVPGCPVCPLVLTQEDIGKKYLVVRGILKGNEGTLREANGGCGRAFLRFQTRPAFVQAWIPIEDLELVD